jgi:hypothetical protein
MNRGSAFSWRWAWVLVLVLPMQRLAAEVPAVSIVSDAHPGPAASHGLDALTAALRAKGVAVERAASVESAVGRVLILSGTAEGNGAAAQRLKADQQPLPREAEGLVIRKTEIGGKPAWVVAGADDRGLMYAELDVADRIGWSSDPAAPFSEVRDAEEKPAVAMRAVSIYTMNRAYWESRFYDEAYWSRYLDTLAKDRFNSLVVIFGYENGGFLAPCYPYFFDTPGFPGVRMVGITPAEQRRNLDALNRLIGMAHARGLTFTVGIWDHIYRGGVQGGGVPGADRAVRQPTPGLVWGVTADNLVPYTKAALAEFLRRAHGVDAIQFRMHDESGLKRGEQDGFWRDGFAMIKQTAPNLRLDLRAKGLPDEVIQSAIDEGIHFRITTKYWMEQMGLPFHPTHINKEDQRNRRHSYADLLRYPKRYAIHWRLWNGGTARILLWGDPEYVRRFAQSTHLYDGDGFEINEPLATKMEGQPHDARPFDLLKPSARYYDYEFERYWHTFQVFGRVGYNPDTPSEVWDREFEQRFGKAAGPHVERALHRASWVLPRIVASSYPYSAFPMTAGWAEKQRLGDLPSFAKSEGSDIQQFEDFDEEAQRLIEGGETARVRPQATSRWFADAARDIEAELAAAEKAAADHRNKEFDSTAVDLRILANLALYHSRRIPAAVSYRLFVRTHDPRTLDDAIAYERSAIEAWRQLVAAAGDMYAPDLMMGARSRGLSGHWRDELAALEKGLAELALQRGAAPAAASDAKPAPRYEPEEPNAKGQTILDQPVATAPVGKPIVITAEVRTAAGVKWVRLRYRDVNQTEDFRMLPMLPTKEAGHYEAVIPAEQVTPNWDLMYLIEAMDERGHGVIHPDLNEETPYRVVRVQR